MLAVGILSVQLGGANIWRIPAAFVFAVAMGAWAGVYGWKVPGYEAATAWSVVVLGLAIACKGAHRALGPSAVSYAMGFLVTTVFIHVVGIFIGELASGSRWRVMGLRAAGVAMTMAGMWFVAQ